MGEWAYLGLAVILLICLSYFVFVYARKQGKVSKIVGYGVTGVLVLAVIAGTLFFAVPSLKEYTRTIRVRETEAARKGPIYLYSKEAYETEGMLYY